MSDKENLEFMRNFPKRAKKIAKSSIDQKTEYSLINFGYQQLNLALSTSVLCGIVIVIGLYDPQVSASLSGWFIYLLVVTALRYLTLWLFNRDKKQHEHMYIWRNLFILGAFFAGSVWAIVGTLLFPSIYVQQVLVMVVLAGIAAGSVPTLASMYLAALVFIVMTLAPLIVNLFLLDNVNSLMGVLFFIDIVYLMVVAQKNYSIIKNAVSLQFENYTLLSNLSEAKSQLELINKKLEEAATHDPLTGVANRNLFMTNFTAALERAKQNKSILALLYMDLDDFKNINDIHGHHIGDRLLLILVSRIEDIIENMDQVSRLGGDEFTIFLENMSNPNEVAKIANKICQKLAEPIYINELEIRTTASIGIGIYPIDGDDFDKVLNVADKAMYYVKDHGGNNFRFNVTLLTGH